MKIPRTPLALLALIPLAGCLHAHRASPPAPLLGLSGVAGLRNACFGRAMSAAGLMPVGASEEQKRGIAFENYYRGFLDAKGQREYIVCLKKDGSPEALTKLPDAGKWLKSAEAMADTAMALFPEEKRIADAVETFSVIDEKQGLQRVVITLRDGSKKTIENRFDRMR